MISQGIERGIEPEDGLRTVIGGIQNESADMIQMGMGQRIGGDMLAQYQTLERQRGRRRHLDVGKAAHPDGDLETGQHRAGVQRNEPPLPDGSQ